MVIVNEPNRMFAAPKERNIAEVHSRLEYFAPLELLSLGNLAVPINIRLLRSGGQGRPSVLQNCFQELLWQEPCPQALKY